MIIVKKLSKTYNSKFNGVYEVFRDINITFPSKGFVCIVGESGCGKTTLFNLIGGLDKDFTGEIKSYGYLLKGNELNEYRNNIVGFIFQDYNLIEEFTVMENLAIPLNIQGYSKIEIANKIHEALIKVNMNSHLNSYPNELSGGEQQRIAIARALIKNSKVILADEPTGNLDDINAKEILDILKDISEDRLVIMVTHDVKNANEFSDWKIEITDSKLAYELVGLETEDTIERTNIIKSKISFGLLLSISLKWLKLNMLRTLLITILFIITLSIIGVGVVVDNTSEIEIISQTINQKDELFISSISSAISAVTYTNDYVIGDIENISGIYEKEELYTDFINEFGASNALLSSRIYIVNDRDNNESLFIKHFNIDDETRLYFLSEEIDYAIPNFVGNMPRNLNEIVISDLLGYLLFEKEDFIGETIKINRYEFIGDIVEKEFIVVGKINTNFSISGTLNFDVHTDAYYYYQNYSIDTPIVFSEDALYAQMFALEGAIDDFDLMHRYVGTVFNGVSYLYENDTKIVRLYGDFYSSEIIDSDSLFGNSPSNSTEICLSIDQLKLILENKDQEIDSLLEGIISWNEFTNIVGLSEVDVVYGGEETQNHYNPVIPDRLTISGVFTEYTYTPSIGSHPIIFHESLILELNNKYPYNKIGLAIINNSNQIQEELEYIYSKKFINVHQEPEINFGEIKMITNSEGSFLLYKSIYDFESGIKEISTSSVFVSIGFGFILLFLFSYTSIQSKQKTFGILRSLGFSKINIALIYIYEGITILIISFIFGLILTNYIVLMISDYLFSNTIFETDRLIILNAISALRIFMIAFLLILSSSFISLIRIIKMSPIDMIKLK